MANRAAYVRTVKPVRVIHRGSISPETQAAIREEVITLVRRHEDKRAAKRNRNRLQMLAFTIFFSIFAATLFRALHLGFMVTYMNPVALTPDLLLCLWAWRKRY